MILPWWPVIATDIIGSVITLILAFCCAFHAWEWTRRKTDDVFRNYIFLLTLAIVFFAISRSFGHLVKQLLISAGQFSIWKEISPFSGAVNTATFVVIFAFGIYFRRFERVHLEIENYKNNLEALVEERTLALAEANAGLTREVEERRRIERAVRESRAVLENVLNSSNPLCITSIDYDILQTNAAYRELWPSQGAGSDCDGKCYDLRPGENCHSDNCPLRQIVGGREIVSGEVSKELRDGVVRQFIITTRPFLDDSGKLMGVVQSFQDISIRKKAEEALVNERERLAVTLKSIGDGVITTDVGGRVLFLNKVAEELTGWHQRDAEGRLLVEVFNIINEKNRQPCENPVDLVLASGGTVGLANHTALIARDGTERSIADSGAPIRDRHSKIIGVVLVFRDVSLELRMEKELQKTRKLESVGVLAGGIAHDFNNILMAILGNINLALLKHDPADVGYGLLREAEKACLRAKGLTHQLLTFSKGGEPVKEVASLPGIIRESAEFVLHGEKVVCDYDFAEDLWLVEIDKNQMSQVVQNLIINASHAMPLGGVIRVSCENYHEGDIPGMTGENAVRLTVIDNGMGIPQNVIDSIFDPYFSTKPGGSGLGLAIAYSIIKKHGGNITVDSQPGKGTTFVIYLPASADQPVTENQPEAVDSGVEAGTRRILVMDDEAMVCKVSEGMLMAMGFEVELVQDGTEALSKFREAREMGNPFDLTIMDLTIPGGMGGRDTVKEFLKIDPAARVVVASGYSNDPVMSSYEEHGFAAALVKPFTLKDLKGVVKAVLSGGLTRDL